MVLVAASLLSAGLYGRSLVPQQSALQEQCDSQLATVSRLTLLVPRRTLHADPAFDLKQLANTLVAPLENIPRSLVDQLHEEWRTPQKGTPGLRRESSRSNQRTHSEPLLQKMTIDIGKAVE